jgi:hypothetical protein
MDLLLLRGSFFGTNNRMFDLFASACFVPNKACVMLGRKNVVHPNLNSVIFSGLRAPSSRPRALYLQITCRCYQG